MAMLLKEKNGHEDEKWSEDEKVRIKMRLEAAIGKQSQPILSPLSDDDFLSFDDRQPSTESELERYLNDKDKRLEMLDKYPNIKKLFMRYNTMLPSSAPVERLFSMAALVLTGKRANFSDTLLEHLILLKKFIATCEMHIELFLNYFWIISNSFSNFESIQIELIHLKKLN